MDEDRRTPEMSRHTVVQAADILGITTGAVRNRLSRGTLHSVKEKRTVYVLLPADMSRDAARDTSDTPGGMPGPGHDASEATDDLREQVRYLREQLRREQDAHAEARRVILALTSRIPQIEAPREPTGGPETVEKGPERAEPQPDAPVPQASQRPQGGGLRGLRRRILGW